MSTYTFDPTGDALQNKVIGETKTLNLPAGRDYLFIIPTYGPYFEESLEIKHTDTNGVSRILEPGVDYNPGFQYVEATAKCNRAIYGGINFVDITLTGTVTYNYQSLGGVYGLTNANITNIQANEVRDPAFTKWELVLSDNGISVQAFPTIDHPYAKVNVETVKRAVDELEEAGLVVHLRPKFLPNPQEAEFIPSKAEIGLGNVDNFQTANNDEALAGVATNRFMTPATSKAALGVQVLEYLSTMGYNVPVPYVAGLEINDVRDTVSYQNSVYAPRPGTIPFTTNGSFERNKFIIINSHERDHWSDPIVFNIVGNEPTALTGAVILQTNQTFEVEVEVRCLLNNVIDLVYKTDFQLDNGTLLVEYPLKANDRLEFFVKEKGSKLPNDRHYYKLLEVTDGSNVFTLPDMDFVNANDLRFTLNDFVVLSKETDYTITDDQLTVTYPLKLGDVIEVENIDIIPEMGKQPMREFLNDPGNNEDVDYERLRDAIESQQATITVLNKSLSGKENTLTPGNVEQYYRGNKTLSNFASDVRAALLTGLSTATNAVVTATDSILSAIGKLQKQISDSISNLASTATGKGAALVGWKQLGTGAVDRTVDAKLKDFVSVKDFGAKGDGVTDDTVAINAAATYARANGIELCIPAVSTFYLISNTIDFSGIKTIDGKGAELRGNFSGIPAAIIGGTSTSFRGAEIYLKVRNTTDKSTVANTNGFKILNFSNSRLTLYARGFNVGLYFDGTAANRVWVDNKLEILELYNNGSHVHFDFSGSTYAVKNQFVGGSYYLGVNEKIANRGTFKITLAGSSLLSDILVKNPEIGIGANSLNADHGAFVYADINTTWDINTIQFENARFEGYDTYTVSPQAVNIASNASGRIGIDIGIDGSVGTGVTYTNFLISVPTLRANKVRLKNSAIRPHGTPAYPQIIIPNETIPYQTTNRCYVPGRVIFDQTSGYGAPVDYFSTSFGVNAISRALGDGDLISGATTDSFGLIYDKSTSDVLFIELHQPEPFAVICYDASGNILSGTNPYYAVGESFRSNTRGAVTLYELNGRWLWLHKDVASFYIGAARWSSNGKLKDISFNVLYGSPVSKKNDAKLSQRNNVSHVSPTQCIMPVGTTLDGVSTNGWRSAFYLKTKNTVAALATDNSITLETVTGIAVNDLIAIELDTEISTGLRRYRFTTVASITGNVIGLNNTIDATVAQNRNVLIGRWTTR